MDRDRDRIMSMFNYGAGRLYGLPKEYRESFSTSTNSSVDGSVTSEANGADPSKQKAGTATPSNDVNTKGGRSGAKSRSKKNPLLGDPQDVDRVVKALKDTGSGVKAVFAGFATMGEGSRIAKAPAPKQS